jgi:hypothetical protein
MWTFLPSLSAIQRRGSPKARTGAIRRPGRRTRPWAEGLEGRALLAAPYYGYALDLGGPNFSEAAAVAVDAAGDAVDTGRYNGTINLDPNNPSNPAGTLTSQNGTSAYLARYDPGGNLLWARSIGGTAGSGARAAGRNVTIDGSGNIYAVGEFWGAINLGNDASGNPVTLSVPLDSYFDYVVKCSPDGTVQWAEQISSGADIPDGLVGNPQGGVLLAGYFVGTGTVGGRRSRPPAATTT